MGDIAKCGMKSKEIKYKLHKSFIYHEDDLSDDLKSKVNVVDDNCFTNLPCKVEWCDTCDGSGNRSRYDVGGYDISSMMYDEIGIIDEGFHEDYFSGRTDIQCDVCEGSKIHNIIDYDSLTPQQEKILSINDRCIREEAYDVAYAEAERSMGC